MHHMGSQEECSWGRRWCWWRCGRWGWGSWWESSSSWGTCRLSQHPEIPSAQHCPRSAHSYDLWAGYSSCHHHLQEHCWFFEDIHVYSQKCKCKNTNLRSQASLLLACASCDHWDGGHLNPAEGEGWCGLCQGCCGDKELFSFPTRTEQILQTL